jgi:GNAT superfamily N-acetyltransferase
MGYSLHLVHEDDAALRAAIQAPLKDFNEPRFGASQFQTLAVAVRDAAGQVSGGLWGHTSYGWLYVQLLVVPEALRSQGVGRQLLALAEAEALRRGCHGAWLDTFSPQAQGFYERLGYVRFGVLAGFPPGHTRRFLQKALKQDQS